MEGAHAFSESFREQIAGSAILFGDEVINVTASLGVALLSANHADPQQLFAAADTALYKAKKNGRDRVELAEQIGDCLPV